MLKIWLPLNKDTRNQGLKNVQITNNGTVLAEGGMLGKCHSIENNGDGIVLNGYMTELKTYTKYTMSAWIYMRSQANGHSSSILSSGNWNTGNGNLCFALYSYNNGYSNLLIPNKGSWTTSISLPNKLVLNTWYHVAITYDGTETKAYINGSYVGKSTSGGICQNSESTNLKVGAATYTPIFTLLGNISDVRIYDSVLTDSEIRELYLCKLFDIDTDVYIDGDVINYMANANTEQGVGWSSFGFGSKGKIYKADIDTPFYGNAIKILASGGTGNFSAEAARGFTVVPLPTNGKITFSFYAKGEGSSIGKNVQAHIYAYSGSTNVSTGTYGPLTDHWKRYSHTLTWNKSMMSGPSFNTYVVGTAFAQNEYFYACNFQLEVGDTAHPYQYSRGIEEFPVDMSGYAPPFNPTSVTKSGSTLYFNGSSSVIATDLEFMKIVDTGYTFSFWVNSTEADSSRSVYFGCGDQGNGWTFSLEKQASTNKFRIYNNDAPNWYVDNCIMTPNQWIHIVVTRSGGTVTVYKNGVSVGTKTGFTNHAAFDKTYYLGADYRTGDTMFKGYMGDFKIYANPLTAAEVSALYNKERIKYQ